MDFNYLNNFYSNDAFNKHVTNLLNCCAVKGR